MVVSSLLVLLLFLPPALLCYCFCPSRYRNPAALMVSLIFHAWGTLRFSLCCRPYAGSTIFWLAVVRLGIL